MWLNVVPSLNQCALSQPTRERAGERARKWAGKRVAAAGGPRARRAERGRPRARKTACGEAGIGCERVSAVRGERVDRDQPGAGINEGTTFSHIEIRYRIQQ